MLQELMRFKRYFKQSFHKIHSTLELSVPFICPAHYFMLPARAKSAIGTSNWIKVISRSHYSIQQTRSAATIPCIDVHMWYCCKGIIKLKPRERLRFSRSPSSISRSSSSSTALYHELHTYIHTCHQPLLLLLLLRFGSQRRKERNEAKNNNNEREIAWIAWTTTPFRPHLLLDAAPSRRGGKPPAEKIHRMVVDRRMSVCCFVWQRIYSNQEDRGGVAITLNYCCVERAIPFGMRMRLQIFCLLRELLYDDAVFF